MRAEQEISILEQISEILGSSLELEDLFGQVMKLLEQGLGIRWAALVIKDEAIDRLRMVAGIGLSDEELRRGQYAVGEGVTGQVVATGEARVVADISTEPEFLDRTGVLAQVPGGETWSFICQPIKIEDKPVGALAVTSPSRDEQTLEADARLVSIIAGNLALALHINQLVKMEKDQWLEETRRLRENLHSKYRFENIIGTSAAMMDVLATVGQVAVSRATVLMLGETGTGKELIAKAIHYNSPRREKPFVRVNCGALSESLLESELFGHVKGSFTGAIRDKVGRFEAADGGSIFLDEIGTLDMQLQVKLLRVLQEREFERVGDHRTIRSDVRVIAATNLDLAEAVRNANFREDLYYRLNVVELHLPPLRSRREDVPQLIDHFLDRYNQENERNLSLINRDLMNVLLRYPWPGNVRELENAVERAVVMSQGEQFTEDLLPIQIRMFAQQGRDKKQADSIESLARRLGEQAVEEYGVREGEVWELTVGEVERQLIACALDRHAGVKTRSADFLGINR
ncbi:MAG: sigma 54-interacting transcriptional regulator, partial [Phycisphaerae bacterium]|nr:sigma 54-interacting transcriptional regulator [Phycisphaerae bacterium]